MLLLTKRSILAAPALILCSKTLAQVGIDGISGGNSDGVAHILGFADGHLGAPIGTIQHPHLLDINSPGTQQFGSTYVTRPAWKVPGVDYSVGVASSVTLQDPAPGGVLAAGLSAISGCSLSGGNTIFFSGSTGATIQGWDFSLNGGYRVECQSSCTNLTFLNCNWKTGTNNFRPLVIDQSCSLFTIKQCVIDGGGSTTTGFAEGNTTGGVDSNCYGGLGIYYCWIKHTPAEGLRVNNSPNGQMQFDFRFNIIEDCGTGSGHTDFNATISLTTMTVTSMFNNHSGPINPGMTVTGTGVAANTVIQPYGTNGTTGVGGTGTYAVSVSQSVPSSTLMTAVNNTQGIHGDMIQSSSATGQQDCTSWRADFNLLLQTQSPSLAGAQGFSCFTANSGTQASPSVVRQVSQRNNVLIAPGPNANSTNMSPMLMIDTAWLNGSGVIDSNYVDPTGCGPNGAGSAVDVGLINGGTDGPNGNGAVTGTVTGNGATNLLDGSNIPS